MLSVGDEKWFLYSLQKILLALKLMEPLSLICKLLTLLRLRNPEGITPREFYKKSNL